MHTYISENYDIHSDSMYTTMCKTVFLYEHTYMQVCVYSVRVGLHARACVCVFVCLCLCLCTFPQDVMYNRPMCSEPGHANRHCCMPTQAMVTIQVLNRHLCVGDLRPLCR